MIDSTLEGWLMNLHIIVFRTYPHKLLMLPYWIFFQSILKCRLIALRWNLVYWLDVIFILLNNTFPLICTAVHMGPSSVVQVQVQCYHKTIHTKYETRYSRFIYWHLYEFLIYMREKSSEYFITIHFTEEVEI